MSWQSFIDKSVGDKKVFTDKDVMELLLQALKYECGCFLKRKLWKNGLSTSDGQTDGWVLLQNCKTLSLREASSRRCTTTDTGKHITDVSCLTES